MRSFIAALFLTVAFATGWAPAFAAEPCSGFKWDVGKEHALFGGKSTLLTAGKAVASAPIIATDRLYHAD